MDKPTYCSLTHHTCLMPCGPLCLRYTSCTAHCHVSHAMWPIVSTVHVVYSTLPCVSCHVAHCVYGTRRVQHTAMCLMPCGPLCLRYTSCTAHCHVSHAMWPIVSTVHIVYSTLPCVSCHVAHCVYGTHRVQHTAMCLMPCGPLCLRYTSCTAHCHVSHAMWPIVSTVHVVYSKLPCVSCHVAHCVYGIRVQHTAMCLMPCGPLCLRYMSCTAHCHVSHAMWPIVSTVHIVYSTLPCVSCHVAHCVYGTCRVQHTAMCLMPCGPLCLRYTSCTANCHADHMSTHQFVCTHACLHSACHRVECELKHIMLGLSLSRSSC